MEFWVLYELIIYFLILKTIEFWLLQDWSFDRSLTQFLFCLHFAFESGNFITQILNLASFIESKSIESTLIDNWDSFLQHCVKIDLTCHCLSLIHKSAFANCFCPPLHKTPHVKSVKASWGPSLKGGLRGLPLPPEKMGVRKWNKNRNRHSII